MWLCCSAFKKMKNVHGFENFVALNSVGMIDYITPIDYQHNQADFVSLFVSIRYDDCN